eukprot:TRINITY_DN34330_c0_g1_i2.p2 TRINITY_DN34330_c0_g1~~TRINITY_DN34330_c0_g1_i2.p2  ORF type:complete len:150 (-),score=29.05 TRINITY_DN34330_c0_g1_i2:1062-1460(-)
MSATRSLRASDRGERVAKVLYIHGLEAGPQGKKVNALRRHFDVQAVQMKTPSFAEIASPGYRQSPEFEKVFRACVQLQLTALSEFRPDVIVASSFGSDTGAGRRCSSRRRRLVWPRSRRQRSLGSKESLVLC